ncbi:MAG TPA: antitoxin Xre-like helix-turn-helix domain-containing protein [Rhodothermales bacterium]
MGQSARKTVGGSESTRQRNPGWSVGLRLVRPDQVIDRVEEGFETRTMENLRARMGLTSDEMSMLLGTSPRTLARRQKKGQLEPVESDRLYRVARLYERAVEVFESEDAARRWFREPVWGLGGKTPLAYARTDPGAREVEALLERIEYSVLA